MTEFDPLELELAAMRPRDPSAELKRRIANQLAAAPLSDTARGQQPVWRGGLLVGGLLAASLAAVILWPGRKQNVETPPNLTLQTDIATAFDESLPSLWSYRGALSQSQVSLDVLLDKHAARTFEHKPGGAPVFALARGNSEIDALLGEL